jgi:hypothetical protein
MTFRGVIHFGCNVSLGHVKDDPERLRRMANYLEEHAEKRNTDSWVERGARELEARGGHPLLFRVGTPGLE